MPDLIVVRLHPVKPTSGAAFTNFFTNLKITAFDLSFADGKVGVKIGDASGAWSPPSLNPLDPKLHNFSPATPKIFQHFSIVTIGLGKVVQLEAVATAVIVLNIPAGHPEYQSDDL